MRGHLGCAVGTGRTDVAGTVGTGRMDVAHGLLALDIRDVAKRGVPGCA